MIRAVAERPTRVSASTRARVHRRRPGLEQIVAWLSLAAVLAADLATIRVGLDAVDEGYFVEQATRVAHGQLPYRDFDSLYTPALLYVHAAVLSVFSASPVLDVRVVGLLARLVLAVGLYVLCRPVVRPLVAVLPSLFVLVALDRLPLTWEPHPAWPSAALTIVTVWAFTRLPFSGGFRRTALLVAIGALAAMVFAFKQNAGVLLGLALVVATAWQGIDGTRNNDVTRALRAVQVLLLVAIVAVVAWLVRPHASLDILAYFLIPLTAAGLTAIRAVPVSATGRGVWSWLRVLAWIGLGGSLVSVPWLVALLAALDWNVGLLKGFVGDVNQDVLWYPLQGPDGGAWASVLGLGVALLVMVRSRRRTVVCACAAVILVVFAASMIILTRDANESLRRAVLLAPGRAVDSIVLFLPGVCILGGALLSMRPLPSATAWWLRWVTVAGALTFLTEYPRVDEVHLTWAACLPLATGALVLARLYTHFTRRWGVRGVGRWLVATALVVVPLAMGLRNLVIRTDGYVVPGNDGSLLIAPMTTLSGPPNVAGLRVTTDQATTLVAAGQFVADNTAPGDAIFVYPTSPLIYVLADRPNPTRFEHLFPGAASASEIDGVIAALDQTPVNVIVVSESDLAFWGPPGDNAPLETYLADHYHEIARFSDFVVLRRR